MVEENKKKYYWLQLHRNFFNRHDIKAIRADVNGDKIVLVYLMLLVESIDHQGYLRFKSDIPYNEKLLSSTLGVSKKVIASSMELLQFLNLLRIEQDGTLFLPELPKLIDSVSAEALKKRRIRESKQGPKT